jgi:hypothetical protein
MDISFMLFLRMIESRAMKMTIDFLLLPFGLDDN